MVGESRRAISSLRVADYFLIYIVEEARYLPLLPNRESQSDILLLLSALVTLYKAIGIDQ